MGRRRASRPTGPTVDPRREPISIYEVHAGSWDRDENDWFLTWDALAERLIPYVVDLGFTHIEFMPVSEHPYDPELGLSDHRPLCPLRPLRRSRRASPASSMARTAPESAC